MIRIKPFLSIFYLSTIIFGSTKSFSQNTSEPEIHIITNIIHLQETAWNNDNLDSFMLFYWNSPELRFVSKKGINKGWQQVYDSYKKGYPDKTKMGILTFDIKSIELIDKKNAVVIGGWEVKNDTGTHAGYFSLWFKKMKGHWVIVVDHTS
ncbi:MAG: DUF4440 domain-containing protein [Bacteroidota bacterium]|nr:DUF4440 domain-containing protein [Bacteroidota bacterium]